MSQQFVSVQPLPVAVAVAMPVATAVTMAMPVATPHHLEPRDLFPVLLL